MSRLRISVWTPVSCKKGRRQDKGHFYNSGENHFPATIVQRNIMQKVTLRIDTETYLITRNVKQPADN